MVAWLVPTEFNNMINEQREEALFQIGSSISTWKQLLLYLVGELLIMLLPLALVLLVKCSRLMLLVISLYLPELFIPLLNMA